MPHLDVFANPAPRSRRVYPLIAVLQADVADTGDVRVVAPLAPQAALPPIAGRLAPLVRIGDGALFVLLIPLLSTVPAARLGQPVDNLAAHRDAIVAALDYLFLGV